MIYHVIRLGAGVCSTDVRRKFMPPASHISIRHQAQHTCTSGINLDRSEMQMHLWCTRRSLGYVPRFGAQTPFQGPSATSTSFACISAMHTQTTHICKLDERAHFHSTCTLLRFAYDTQIPHTHTHALRVKRSRYWQHSCNLSRQTLAVSSALARSTRIEV